MYAAAIGFRYIAVYWHAYANTEACCCLAYATIIYMQPLFHIHGLAGSSIN